MRLDGRPAAEHLTYCTNVHPGETLPEVMAALDMHVPRIKALAAPDRRFGLGLRLSARAVAALAEPGAMTALQALLVRHDAYVFTLNGFPYGTFHDVPVKGTVYLPHWGDPARLLYTDRLAAALAELLPEGTDGSISTVPLGPRHVLAAEGERVVAALLRHVATLVALDRTAGRRIALALEPEPSCALETTAEAIAFVEERLLVGHALDLLAGMIGGTPAQAEAAMRRHLGICLDVCHAAVEFEDPRDTVGRLRAAGIAVPKLQLSSALRVPVLDAAAADALRRYDEPVYLHQVVSRQNGVLRRYDDLGAALARLSEELGAEWRVHFHVPLFRDEMQAFSTTQGVLAEMLALHREVPISSHLEIETYTWDVLPAADRDGALSEAIAREYGWVRQRLAA